MLEWLRSAHATGLDNLGIGIMAIIAVVLVIREWRKP